MNHTIHSINNHLIILDVFDDDGTLIIGNYSCNVPKDITDIEAFVVNTVYTSFVLAEQQVSDKQMIEASPVLVAMETAKESMKWGLILKIKEIQEIALDSLIGYAEETYGWDNAGLIPKMIFEYVTLAGQKGFITIEGSSKEYYFEVLKQIILNSTGDQLMEMLK